MAVHLPFPWPLIPLLLPLPRGGKQGRRNGGGGLGGGGGVEEGDPPRAADGPGQLRAAAAIACPGG
jgi:hypothetical protein